MYAEEVADIAMEFMREKAGYAFPRLEKVTFSQTLSEWEVLVDAGVYGEKIIKRVVIDDATRKVIRFE